MNFTVLGIFRTQDDINNAKAKLAAAVRGLNVKSFMQCAFYSNMSRDNNMRHITIGPQ